MGNELLLTPFLPGSPFQHGERLCSKKLYMDFPIFPTFIQAEFEVISRREAI